MSLYVRLHVSFWNHRKTLRLRSLIGNDAFWIPPRLWSYAAENQPDGDFSDYLPTELAMILGFSGDAEAMLQALQKSGFMDDKRINDWSEHNSYHSVFSERAKVAARARWKRKEKKGDKHCMTHACSKTEGEKPEISSLITPEPSASSMLPCPADIYLAYPRKCGRLAAIKAIQRAIKLKDAAYLLERTIAFAKTQGPNDRFTPHPATWFNQGRYDDDPATWNLSNGQNKRPHTESTRNAGTQNSGKGGDYAGIGKLPNHKS